jgi:hypothetical protein
VFDNFMPRKKNPAKQDRLNFWLSHDLRERVQSLANSKGWTLTEAARNLIAEGLEAHEKPSLRAEIDEIKRRLDILSNAQGHISPPGASMANRKDSE